LGYRKCNANNRFVLFSGEKTFRAKIPIDANAGVYYELNNNWPKFPYASFQPELSAETSRSFR
jgi:hypothetical protein